MNEPRKSITWSPEAVHALVEKFTCKSEFKGLSDENVWCGRWDTKL